MKLRINSSYSLASIVSFFVLFLPAINVHAVEKLSMEMDQINESQLLTKVHKSNLAEIKIAQLAKDKSSRKDIIKFSELLIQDHTLADMKVQSVAKSLNLSLNAPPANVEEDKAEQLELAKAMELLSSLAGESFDRAFLEIIMERHKKSVQKLTEASNAMVEGQVKSLILSLLPVIQKHYDMAKMMLQ